jgi:hypothetical protein
MAITDIQISEELKTNAPSIKYRGNEGPKSPQEMEQMIMASLEEEYAKYVFEMQEQGLEPMSMQKFIEQAMAEGQMSGGQPLPQDPTKPVNPFQPKPQGPVLPDRQMAAYGGIMGADGRKKYGIGSILQKAKDKLIDDLIPNEIKENPLLTAAIVAGGNELLPGGADRRQSVIDALLGAKDYTMDKISEISDISIGDSTLGENIKSGIAKNIVPIVGGLTAGLFTKNTESNTPGLPSDDTALNLAEYKKAANLLDQKQGLAADMNFLPTVASRKYSPEEMAITYAQAVANGGRIGFDNGGMPRAAQQYGDFKSLEGISGIGGRELMNPKDQTRYLSKVSPTKEVDTIKRIYEERGNQGLQAYLERNPDLKYKYVINTDAMTNELFVVPNKLHEDFLNMEKIIPLKAQGGRINRAEGGIMDLGGMEKDYRAEGGFVPIGKEEKADDVPARLSVNEFVFTADAVRNAGGGDIDQGAQVMENMMKHLEAGGQVSEESQGMQGARDMFEVSERLSEVI